MNAVSLFSGAGGFDLALERNGIPVVANVEIDAKCRQVLKRHFPNAVQLDDVRKVTGEQLRASGFIPDDGIIVGGFPCQDLSIAGKREGLGGARSGLFFEIIRLARELEPEWLILENVPGLLSSDQGRDMGRVLGALVECGFGVAWRILDAQHFGTPQRRRRVFIVARRAGDLAGPSQVLFDSEGLRGDSATKREARASVATGTTVSTLQGGGERGYRIDAESAAGGHLVAHTLTTEYDASEDGTGRGTPLVVDQVAYGQTGFAKYTEGQLKTLAESNYKRPEDNLVVPFVKVIRSGARDAGGNLPPEVWAEREIAPTLNAFDNGDVRTPVLLTMREGKPGGGKGPLLSENKSLTLATGNGQVLFDPVAGTLRSHPRPGSNSSNEVVETAGVRRLSPMECERLQGFPDGWTGGQADSTRYRQMGNAVAVPVIEAIVRRLVKVDCVTVREGVTSDQHA